MRSVLVRSVLLVACVAVASPASAQFASPFHILPVVAKLQGEQGTDWRSDVSISNLSDAPATVGLNFLREKRANAFPEEPDVTLVLPAGATRQIEDVLGTHFPGEGATKGALIVQTVDDSADPAMLAVSSRTYNAPALAEPQSFAPEPGAAGRPGTPLRDRGTPSGGSGRRSGDRLPGPPGSPRGRAGRGARRRSRNAPTRPGRGGRARGR